MLNGQCEGQRIRTQSNVFPTILFSLQIKPPIVLFSFSKIKSLPLTYFRRQWIQTGLFKLGKFYFHTNVKVIDYLLNRGWNHYYAVFLSNKSRELFRLIERKHSRNKDAILPNNPLLIVNLLKHSELRTDDTKNNLYLHLNTTYLLRMMFRLLTN